MKFKHAVVEIIIAMVLVFSTTPCFADEVIPSTDDFEGPGAKWGWTSRTDVGMLYPELTYVPGDYDAEVPNAAKALGWWGEQCLKVTSDRTYARAYFIPPQSAVIASYDMYMERMTEYDSGRISVYMSTGSTSPIIMNASYVTTDTWKLSLEVGWALLDDVVLMMDVPYHISTTVDSATHIWSWYVNGSMEGYGSYKVTPFTEPVLLDSFMYLFSGPNQIVYMDNIELRPKTRYKSYLPLSNR